MIKLLTIIGLFICFFASAQLDTTKLTPNNNASIQYGAVRAIKGFGIPVFGKWSSDTLSKTPGLISVINNNFYFVGIDNIWRPLITSATAASTYQPIGSYATTTQNALKINIADSAAMLANYRTSINSNTSNIAANTTSIGSLSSSLGSLGSLTTTDKSSVVNAINENKTAISSAATSNVIGVASPTTNPGTPVSNVAYNVSGAGTYTNFNSAAATPIVVSSTDGLVILRYNTVTGFWTKITSLQDLSNYYNKTSIDSKVGALPLNNQINGFLTVQPFAEINKNIFDPTQAFSASYHIAGDGSLAFNAAWSADKTTTYLNPVDSSSQYLTSSAGNLWVGQYTGAGTFISAANFSSATPLNTTSTTKYIRVQMPNIDASTYMIRKAGTTSVFEAFRATIKETYLKYLYAPLSAVPDTATLIVKTTGKNILNPNQAWAASSHVQTNGTVTFNAAWSAEKSSVNMIAVESSTQYLINSAGNVWVVQYDSLGAVTQTGANFSSATPLNTLSTTMYIRLQMPNIDLSAYMIRKAGTTSVFEAYKLIIPSTYLTDYALTTQLPDTSITVKKNAGKNILNPDLTTFTQSAHISNSDGSVSVNGAWVADQSSGFIPVESSTQYVTNYAFNIWTVQYDVNKNYIAASGANLNSVTPYTTSSTAKYIRIQLAVGSVAAIMIRKSTSTPSFEPYQLVATIPLDKPVMRANVTGLDNRIALPSKQYLLKGIQNTIYYQPAQYRWNPNLFFTQQVGTGITSFTTRATLTPATTTGITVTAYLYDAEFDAISTKTYTTVIGDSTLNNGAINYLSMGDSYTEPGVWQQRVRNLCPGLTLIGTRRGTPSLPSTLLSEGRSGWQLSDYFSTSKLHSADGYYTPFLQPIDPYKYFGGTAMWIAALAAGANNPLYATAVSLNLNSSTGLRNSPNTNDVMWVDASSAYKYWDGSAWTTISQSTLGFAFNFAKYRATYSIPTVNIFSFMLGINDFSSTFPPSGVTTSYTTWKVMLDTLIAGVKRDNQSVKIGIHLPTSYFPDAFEGANGYISRAKSMAMFLQREALIRDYDNLDVSSNIWLVDVGSALDPVYGWRVVKNTPFPEYTVASGYTDETRTTYVDQIHPEGGLGYQQIGTRVGAWVQSIR